MKKLKILYLVSTLKKCGPINILYGIIKGLDKDRFDIFIICLSREGENSMTDDFLAMNIQIINLNNDRIEGLIKNKMAVQSFVDTHKLDVVHSHGLRADSINSKLKRVISINTIHNFPKEDYIFRYGKTLGRVMEIAHKKAITQIRYPIACSKTVRDKFLLNYGITTCVVQNGIDRKEFLPAKGLNDQLRKGLNLPSDKNVFIVSGALTELKNPKLIINAFNQLQDTNSLLLFIGNGKLLKTLSQSNQNKRIIFRGKVDQVHDYLKASNYYISASLTEGLPNSVLEAMSSGLPCLLSNIPSHMEIVGKTYNYLFNPKDSVELMEKVKLILKNDTIEISQYLENKIAEIFNTETMSKQYQAVYLDQIKRAI